MIKNKKIMVITTLDNMIWNFLIPHIKFLQEQGNTVECVCAKSGFWFDELKDKYGLKVHEIDFTRNPISIKNLKGYKKLKELQKKEKFDLIYCHQPVGGVMGRLIARKFKLPCIYTVHGFHFFKGNSKIKNFVFRTIEKYCSKWTDALITINEEDYQAALKMKAKKVYKINGIGVDFDKYKVDENLNKTELRKELGLNNDDFVVLSVGELNENKNTYRLLESIKNIEDDKIKYLVCGEGPLKEDYEQYVKENHLKNKVKILAYRKDVQKLYQIANVYIMPSYREGLSRAMMEAMCYGLPVIASKIRGNTDLLGDNEGGVLCNPYNTEDFSQSILKMKNDKELMLAFSNRNREFVKNYDLKVVLKQLDKIYEEFYK